MSKMHLYHTGFSIISDPDIRHGRQNADFGQGFYLSPDRDFAKKWAKYSPGMETYINEYELDMEGLKVKELNRDKEWFDYIFSNRRFMDTAPEYDVVVGPIANDTIFDTLGILTAGVFDDDEALTMYMAGPEYYQVVIKTDRARENLKWLKATQLSREVMEESARQVLAERNLFIENLNSIIEEMQ